ncbi:DUF2612 domain-containing protein [Saccharibacter floricola]|uniref:DUF2612 domain-containing protein n=2 Tax=Saccharibacter floricola TaxID=231053 RepID=UPI0003750BE0|nr:DUF2612 domain-containing protein [Saccharibacter floricola]
MDNLRSTILAQYANSPRLLSLISTFNQAADPHALIERFYNDVWNIDTAKGWGLDVWGRIVGVGRVQKVPQPRYLGFDEANDSTGTALPFNEGFFYNGPTSTQNFALADDAYRRLIMAKAAANISSGSIADINRILMLIFGDRGMIYLSEGTPANDYLGFSEAKRGADTPQTFNNGIFFAATSLANANGTMTICHSWPLSPLDATIIQQSGALPRPSGVTILYQQVHL